MMAKMEMDYNIFLLITTWTNSKNESYVHGIPLKFFENLVVQWNRLLHFLSSFEQMPADS